MTKFKKKNSALNISERKVLLVLFDIIAVFAGLVIYIYFWGDSYISFDSPNINIWLSTLFGYYFFFGNVFEMYNLKVASDRYRVLQALLLTILSTVLLYVFTPYITPLLPSYRFEVFYFFLVLVFTVSMWRLFYCLFIFRPKFHKNIVLVGGVHKIENLIKAMDTHNINVNIVAYISNKVSQKYPNLTYKNVGDVVIEKLTENQPVDEIITSSVPLESNSDSGILKQLTYLFENGVNIIDMDAFYEEITQRVAKGNLNHEFYKYISFSKNHENRFYLVFRRMLDIILAVVGLLCLLLFIPFVCLGNLLANRGPLVYKQIRVGVHGKEFSIYKFRSMVTNAEKGKAQWAVKNDYRITPFGKFIRKTRIDEMPQFWNILIGEMSFIGPRPERPEFANQLKNEIPFYAIRNVIRPGLTGWAQVMYPYANTIEEQEIKIRYDLYYIRSRNLMMDFQILMRTINTVLRFKGQ